MGFSKKRFLEEVAKAREERAKELLPLATRELAARERESAAERIQRDIAYARREIEMMFGIRLSMSQAVQLRNDVEIANRTLGPDNQIPTWQEALYRFYRQEFGMEYDDAVQAYYAQRNQHGHSTDLPIQQKMRKQQEEQFLPFNTHE